MVKQHSDSLQAAPSKYDAAKAWLAAHLGDGAPHVAGGVIASGFMAGYGEQTLRRAAKALGVYKTAANVGPVKRPGTQTELWYLPTKASADALKVEGGQSHEQ